MNDFFEFEMLPCMSSVHESSRKINFNSVSTFFVFIIYLAAIYSRVSQSKESPGANAFETLAEVGKKVHRRPGRDEVEHVVERKTKRAYSC